MMPLAIRRATRCISSLTPLLFILSRSFATGIAFAATVGDQVELKATHPAGVPFHNAPGGSQQFQRVPTGTVATVIGSARGGRWLQIRLPDARTGWIAARYVGRTRAGAPPPDTSAERLVWSSPEGCQQVMGSGGRMAPADPAILLVSLWPGGWRREWSSRTWPTWRVISCSSGGSIYQRKSHDGSGPILLLSKLTA